MSTQTTDHSIDIEGWYILELFGHRRLAGYLRPQEIAGAAMLRLDIPGPDGGTQGATTQYYNASAVYCMTPTTEDVARALAHRQRPEPAHRWELAPTTAARLQPTSHYDAAYDAEDNTDPHEHEPWAERESTVFNDEDQDDDEDHDHAHAPYP